MKEILQGNTMAATGEFLDLENGNAPYDPPIVKVKWKKPDDNVADWTFGIHPEVIREATGKYKVYAPGLLVGVHTITFYDPTVTLPAAGENRFRVRDSLAA